MALVTVQRSPSPSTEHDLDTLSSEDTTDGKSHLKKRLKTSKEKLRKVIRSVRFLSKLRPRLSESYFTFKGAALILPHIECSSRKSIKRSHGGEIQDHLQAMLLLLRTEDQVKIAVRLEDVPNSLYKRYITVVSTRGRQDTEEAVILGMDCRHGEAVIGLVLPVWLGLKIQLEGDGSFRLCIDEQAYLFNPVSVQAMWSAIQSLVKVLHRAEEMKYIHDGLSHTWVEYYRSRIDYTHVCRNHHWNIEGVQVFAPYILNEEDESVKVKISKTLKEVMLLVDLDEVSCRDLRLAVEENLGYSIKEHKSFFDEEMLRIFGQMDAPSKILDYLYLGSEWNASNLDELKEIGIGYILNVTKEIDNFFTGNFHYFTIRLHDVPESDLLKHWDKTFKFIAKARANGSKVLVHCKMGISRSGSTVMAYLMKENRWSVDEAFKFVKERRSVVNPNTGFMEQLHMYEAILSASNKREYFRSKAADAQADEEVKDGSDQDQDCVLGDSMMNVMAEDWNMMISYPGLHSYPSTLEENLDQLPYGPRLLPLGPDLEGTESRSGDSLEESLPDIPSPLLAGDNAGAIYSDLISDADDNSESCNVDTPSSTSPGLARIKPDSFWIRQDTLEDSKDEEMMDAEVASDSDVVLESQARLSTGEITFKSSEPSCEEETNNCLSYQEDKLYPTSLSTSDSKVFVKDQPSSLISNLHVSSNTPGSPFIPTQPSTNDDGLSNVHYVNTVLLGLAEKTSVTSCTNVPLASTQTDSLSQRTFDSNAVGVHVGAHEVKDMTKSETDLLIGADGTEQKSPSVLFAIEDNECFGDGLKFIQSKEECVSSVPHRGKVESGVRDYFLREKIPWHPGKVQKMREGIDRHGAIGDLSDEKEGAEPVCCGEMTGQEKMDVDQNKIILEERMEVSCDLEQEDMEGMEGQMEGDCALSLYEKEEIPLEPGTVLRTRNEIEERHRSSTGDGDMPAPLTTDVSPSKPVLRTSSLKTMKESQLSSLPPRRVSCGPIMEPFVPLNKMEDDPVMEEDVDEGLLSARGNEDENQWISQERNMPKSRTLDFISGGELVPDFNWESSTDPVEEQEQENSGIVRSFVRKLENQPADLKRIGNLNEDDNDDDDDETAVPDNDVLIRLSNSQPFTSDCDAKWDLGFHAGESNTDCPSVVTSDQISNQESSDTSDSSVVRHLVGQFEVKSPEQNKGITDSSLVYSDSLSFTGAQNRFEVSGESQPALRDQLPVVDLTKASKYTCSLSSFPAQTEVQGRGSSDLSKPVKDDGQMKEGKHKEVWNPYEQTTAEDIQSLRRRFETIASTEDNRNRRQTRPKSIERMGGDSKKSIERMGGDGKNKGDVNCMDEKGETSLRQVSEEGRKVRRLHGKSHPLFRLSQTRGGVSHSSM